MSVGGGGGGRQDVHFSRSDLFDCRLVSWGAGEYYDCCGYSGECRGECLTL